MGLAGGQGVVGEPAGDGLERLGLGGGVGVFEGFQVELVAAEQAGIGDAGRAGVDGRGERGHAGYAELAEQPRGAGQGVGAGGIHVTPLDRAHREGDELGVAEADRAGKQILAAPVFRA